MSAFPIIKFVRNVFVLVNFFGYIKITLNEKILGFFLTLDSTGFNCTF